MNLKESFLEKWNKHFPGAELPITFYYTDEEGKGELVKPTPECWTSGCYVCIRCGRIIRQSDREVVGLSVNNALTEAEKAELYSELT